MEYTPAARPAMFTDVCIVPVLNCSFFMQRPFASLIVIAVCCVMQASFINNLSLAGFGKITMALFAGALTAMILL